MTYPATLISKNVKVVFAMEDSEASTSGTQISNDYLARKYSSDQAIQLIKDTYGIKAPLQRVNNASVR